MTEMSSQNINWKTPTIALVGTIIVLAVVIGIVVYTTSLNSHGTIKAKAINCQIYFDPGATQVVTEVNWGTLLPNDGVNQTVYIKNTGNSPANITWTTSNPYPATVWDHVTFNINIPAAKNVPAGAIVPATLSLIALPSDATGNYDFGFTIVITATG